MQYGYFDNEKREYVIDNVALPCSWTNYLGVEDMAAFINHTAGGYLFYKIPEYHRISRFRGNGVPMDRRDSMYISGIMKRRITIPSPGSGSQGFIQGKIPLPPRTVLHRLRERI